MSFSPEKKITIDSPNWVVNSKSCKKCKSKFGLFNRKHHCRACGEIFCAEHSSKKIRFPLIHETHMNRVCDLCFDKISLANANMKLINNDNTINTKDINVKNINEEELLINNNLEENLSNKRTKSNVTFSSQIEEVKTEYSVINIPLLDQFEKAQWLLKNGPKIVEPSNETKLRIYGLFKQATAGPCDDSVKVPGMFDPIGRSKYMSWKSYNNMSQDIAMKEYVALINSLMPASFKIETTQEIIVNNKDNNDLLNNKNSNNNDIPNTNVKIDNTNELNIIKFNSTTTISNSALSKEITPSERWKKKNRAMNEIASNSSSAKSSSFNIFYFLFYGVILHYFHIILLSLSNLLSMEIPTISSVLNEYSAQFSCLENYNWYILFSFDYIQLYYRTLISLSLVLLIIGSVLLFMFIAHIGFCIIYILAEIYSGGLKSVYIMRTRPSPTFIGHVIILISSILSYQNIYLFNLDQNVVLSIIFLCPCITMLMIDARNKRVQKFINLNNSFVKSSIGSLNIGTIKENGNDVTNITLNDINNALNHTKLDSTNMFFQPELPSNKSDIIVWLSDNILIHCFAGFSLGLFIYVSIHFILYKLGFNVLYEIILGKLINHLLNYWQYGIYNSDLFIHHNNIINSYFK